MCLEETDRRSATSRPLKKTVPLISRHRPRSNASVLKSANFRLSLSLSLILLLHRLLFRFFSRLRTNLLTKEATPFRRRNPRISRSLTSRLAPAIGASLAGFALGVYPAGQLRITIAIYVAVKSAEFLYNTLENDGWFKDKPWWWGSWMLMPLSTAQLLHAFLFDRDSVPKVGSIASMDCWKASILPRTRPTEISFLNIPHTTSSLAPPPTLSAFHGQTQQQSLTASLNFHA